MEDILNNVLQFIFFGQRLNAWLMKKFMLVFLQKKKKKKGLGPVIKNSQPIETLANPWGHTLIIFKKRFFFFPH